MGKPTTALAFVLLTLIASPRTVEAAEPTPLDMRRSASVFASVAERVSPSVVQLDVAVPDTSSAALRWFKGLPGQTAVRRGLGSGIIFSAEGHIVTNNHVIEDALAINVRLKDGRMLPASLIGRDIGTDLAVIKVNATGLQAASFANSDDARVGEWVMAVGSPFGLGHTVTTGVLSAKGRGGLGVNAVEDYLQTDASINPGNSGGPLLNLDGQVIGINTMIVGRGQGIGFAVPSNLGQRVALQLIRTGRVQRAWIGVGTQDLTPDVASVMGVQAGSGALINHVAAGGPGAQARMQAGDIVSAVAHRPVRDAQDLMREVMAHEVGDKVRLDVVRGGRKYATEVVLAARNETAAPPLPMQRTAATGPTLGLTLRNVSIRRGEQAVAVAQVAQVAPGSPADRAGLRAQDLVVRSDSVSLPTAEQIVASMEDGKALLLVQRGSGSFFAALQR